MLKSFWTIARRDSHDRIRYLNAKNYSFPRGRFLRVFPPVQAPIGTLGDIWGGHGLETYGDDLQLAFNYDANHVWTVVDGDEGPDQWIIPGFHQVNRVCYLLTEVAHNDAPIEFRIEHRPRSLTPLGLVRRVSSLKKILTLNKEKAC